MAEPILIVLAFAVALALGGIVVIRHDRRHGPTTTSITRDQLTEHLKLDIDHLQAQAEGTLHRRGDARPRTRERHIGEATITVQDTVRAFEAGDISAEAAVEARNTALTHAFPSRMAPGTWASAIAGGNRHADRQFRPLVLQESTR